MHAYIDRHHVQDKIRLTFKWPPPIHTQTLAHRNNEDPYVVAVNRTGQLELVKVLKNIKSAGQKKRFPNFRSHSW